LFNLHISYFGEIESFTKRFSIYFVYLVLEKFYSNFLYIFVPKTLDKKISTKLKIKYYTESYKYDFLNYKFERSYRHRITHAIFLEKNGTIEASNYLNIIYSLSFFEKIGLSRKNIKYLNCRNFNKSLFINNSKNKKKINSILLFGPSHNFDKNIKVDNEDYIVINKPINVDNSFFSHKRIILILNNTYTLNNKQKIITWSKKNKDSIIFCPIDIGLNSNTKAFNNILDFPFSCGLMGLQRSISILLSHYEINKIYINGYNFMLAKNAYDKSYPSLLKKEFNGNVLTGIIKSNMKHDFILNFMFIKKIDKKYPNLINGDIRKFIKLNPIQALDLFKNIYYEKN
tara:strand:- start:105 stop:1133 length:1029 start_codon:yes stop_codon:yes gene_type:complete